MERINVIKDKHLTLWKYSFGRIDLQSTCSWFASISKTPGLETDYISLEDLTNRNDEGNTSSKIFGEFISSDIYDKVKKAVIDTISLTGKYKGKLIVFGVDLRNGVFFITLENKNADFINEIENVLSLEE